MIRRWKDAYVEKKCNEINKTSTLRAHLEEPVVTTLIWVIHATLRNPQRRPNQFFSIASHSQSWPVIASGGVFTFWVGARARALVSQSQEYKNKEEV